MTPLELHEKAMHYSFLAKQARDLNEEETALENYEIAAKSESEAANFYLDKYDFEPTRSILIRSAAFLNLKAGLFEDAEKFIFHGLLNIDDPLIKEQLYVALELCMAYKDFDKKQIGFNVEYISKLRQRSVLYYISPISGEHGTAVSLDMVGDFSTNFTKSIGAYSKSKYKDYFIKLHKNEKETEIAATNFQNSIKPLLTSAGFGSFKFALATDMLYRMGEQKDLIKLKSDILLKYHKEVFTQELTDENINYFKKDFSANEIEEIFRPLLKIKSNNQNYKVGYYDRETLKKQTIAPILNQEKSKLLPVKYISKEDIGKLESVISHKRETTTGASSRSIILRQEMRTATFDYPIKFIEPKGLERIILNEEIRISVDFDSEQGFTLTFEDLNIISNSNSFDDALDELYIKFLQAFRNATANEILDSDNKHWKIVTRLVNDPTAL